MTLAVEAESYPTGLPGKAQVHICMWILGLYWLGSHYPNFKGESNKSTIEEGSTLSFPVNARPSCNKTHIMSSSPLNTPKSPDFAIGETEVQSGCLTCFQGTREVIEPRFSPLCAVKAQVLHCLSCPCPSPTAS